MSRLNAYDDNFKTITGLDGKPTRVLKDKGRVRISMSMRDAVVGTGSHGPRGEADGDLCTIDGREGRLRNVNGELQCVPLKSQDAKPQFTDGRTTDPTALNRPGYRIPIVQDRRAVHDAYEAYETDLTNAYLGGAQSEDGTSDPVSDSLDHKDKMQDCYAAYDHELTEAWRGR
jgi:hypothetical protein